MIDYIKEDGWKIIEEGWDPKRVTQSESLFSLGNGKMGHRANFEETYTGDTFQGNYVAGVYYPDKTRVGWWKNGYPEYFAKVLNAANWAGLKIKVNGIELDFNSAEVLDFKRELNMYTGLYTRSARVILKDGTELNILVERLLSIVDDECGAYRYNITPVNDQVKVEVEAFVDFDVMNEDSNYDEKFWNPVSIETHANQVYVTAKTKKKDFYVCSGARFQTYLNGEKTFLKSTINEKYNWASTSVDTIIKAGDKFSFIKYGTNVSSENYPKDQLATWATENLSKIRAKGFDTMVAEQANAWKEKWEHSDVKIEGDIKAQQAVRYNIYMLDQTYTGKDDRLNIGPKGFTGEKYGGATYWDTEAYCLPFYLSNAPKDVARQLLVYRYKQLDKAIENAEKLGFKDGAALYPMVTMNGEECHNEWEITFEEIHRNGAIAYAIKRYIDYNDEPQYLAEYGLEVLIGISRFWAQRFHYSTEKEMYVMHGVTGPNEYENNINNNWYTNYIANWTMRYTLDSIRLVAEKYSEEYKRIIDKVNFKQGESDQWQNIIQNTFYPKSEKLGIFLQQDGFLDKEQMLAKDLPAEERPINQHWSWDRILRSVFIKQADVLQGLYFFEEDFDQETIQKNYDFYEPRTVHESSLSPCVHSIIAAKLGDVERAYEFYLRTARLDLDDYNAEVHEGLHITSMAGSWMSIVEGFGGMRHQDGILNFYPRLPKEWNGYEFKISYRERVLNITVAADKTTIELLEGAPLQISLYDNIYELSTHQKVVASL